MNSCLNCGKPVKNKYCGTGCQNTHQRKGWKYSKESIRKRIKTIEEQWKTFIVKCHKCEKEFEIKEYNVTIPKKNRYYCSLNCSNSRSYTQEQRLLLSEKAKHSEKVKLANINNGLLRRGLYFGYGQAKKSIGTTITQCLYCKKDIIHKRNKLRKYHKECWLQCSGGIRKGTSRGKSGYYRNHWCDSSYELAWIVYQIDHNVSFKRNKVGFDYVFENKKRKFYPDFILADGLYVEIKNYKSPLTEAKLKSFPFNIKILYKDDIKKDILPYVVHKYGNDFIKLYENGI